MTMTAIMRDNNNSNNAKNITTSNSNNNNNNNNTILAILPLSIPLLLILYIIQNPLPIIKGWIQQIIFFMSSNKQSSSLSEDHNNNTNDMIISSQLLAYTMVGIIGYILTSKLIPNIQIYTLRKNICGKDLGKRGTPTADIPIPEALGMVPGAVLLVCLILCLAGYTTIHSTSNDNIQNNDSTNNIHHHLHRSSNSGNKNNNNKINDVNSALLSICFMLFLGFTDDVLDWPWRYKLILPTIASLPLLCCYKGSTNIVVPIQLRSFLWNTTTNTITHVGYILQNIFHIITIYPITSGALIDLGFIYLLYMSMLAVFCTNAINIFAGINGLEAGQSYIIGIAILIHNLIEIILLLQKQQYKDENNNNNKNNNNDNFEIQEAINNHLFSIMIICTFVGTCLGLLKHNWYPASVFVGDTFCYFAGMTFAVVGILGHFSKTLLLFFIPQVINFLWSTPQLFKFVPCPRHRLPSFNPKDGLLHPSTFDCNSNEYKWLKAKPNDTKGINMTVLNLCLQIFGPMNERNLCITLLVIQIVCCSFGFFCRYYVANFFFDGKI